MIPNQELVEYVRRQIQAGHSADEIKTNLNSVGWDHDSIEAAFSVVQPQPIQANNNVLKKPKKTWLIILLVLIVAALLGTAGYFVYNKFFAPKPQTSLTSSTAKYEVIDLQTNASNVGLCVYIPKEEATLDGLTEVTKAILDNEAKGKNTISILFYDDKEIGKWLIDNPVPPSRDSQTEVDAYKTKLTHFVGQVDNTNPAWTIMTTGTYKDLNGKQLKI